MTDPPDYCTPDTLLQDVARLLVVHDCAVLPVVQHPDSRKPIGVVTSLGIAACLVTPAARARPLYTADAMTTPAPTITLETRVADARAMLDDASLQHLLVVDDTGNCVGVVSSDRL